MTQGCGVSTPLRNQTMYLSHELAESITDPLVDDATSYGPPLAWYDSNCPSASSACGEIADKCNQQTTTESGWTVQLMWSNLDGACVGTEASYVAPSVSFSGPQSISPGASASFLASATDPSGNTASASWNGQNYAIPSGISSLSWSWGDGAPPSTGVSAVHTFASPGIYNVSVTATDNLGFTGTTTQQVEVWGPLGPPTAQTGAAVGLGRTTATLDGSINSAGLSVGYRFDYGRTSTALTSSTPVAIVPSGTSAASVRGALRGLVAGRRYYYRLDAVLSGQTLPGTVASFTTSAVAPAQSRAGGVARVAAAGSHKRSKATRNRRRAKAHSRRKRRTRTARVRVALAVAPARVARVARGEVAARVAQTQAVVLGGQTLAGELRDGLRVSFHCARACHVSLEATLSLPGKLGVVAVPRVLASGSATLAGARGAIGAATLHFSSSARAWLSQLHSAKFVVSVFQRV
jgi:PKD repeat protein